MKRPMIKALAMAMAITMAISTPLSVEAAGLADLYRVNESGNTEGGTENEGTRPIDPENTKPIDPENTKPIDPENTKPIDPENTKPIDPENTKPINPEKTESGWIWDGTKLTGDDLVKVRGLVLSESDVVIDLEKTKTATLSATILGDVTTRSGKNGSVMTVAINAANLEAYEDVNIVLNGKQVKATELVNAISWDCYDTYIATLSKGENGGVITVNGKNGGKTGIYAALEGTRYSAYANVVVINYAKSLTLEQIPNIYVKHGWWLDEYLSGKDYNDAYMSYDAIAEPYTWELTAVKNGKAVNASSFATVSANGYLSAKKITPDNVTLSLRVVTDRGVASNSVTFKITEGNPVKSLSAITGDGKKFDLGNAANTSTLNYTVTATPKNSENGGITTDSIWWRVDKGPAYIDDWNQDGNTSKVTIVPYNVGKVKLTARTTSGKSKSITVTVTAKELRKVYDWNQSIYLGQSVKAETDPYQYTGKFTYTLEEESAVVAVNKSKGTVTLKKGAQIPTDPGYVDIKVKATPKDKKVADKAAVIPVRVYNSTVTGVSISNKSELQKSKTNSLYVNNNSYYAKAVVAGLPEGVSADSFVSWKTSNYSVASFAYEYDDDDDYGSSTSTSANPRIIVKKPGTAKLTVTVYDSKGKAKSDSVTVQVKQAATKIVVDKTNAYVNTKSKKQTVTIKSSFPKGVAKETVTWTPMGTYSNFSIKGANNKTSVKIEVAANTQAGESATFQVRAYNGVTAKATVTVVDETGKIGLTTVEADAKTAKGVAVTTKKANKTYEITIDRGDKLDLKKAFVLDAKDSTKPNLGNAVYTISGNKGNISLSDGVLYGVKDSGKKSVKVTIKAPAGKPSVTLTVKVKEPTPAATN